MSKDDQELSTSSSEERQPAEVDSTKYDTDAFWRGYPLMFGQAQATA